MHASLKNKIKRLPRYALAPVPAFALNPLLKKIVRRTAQNHPEIFERIGAGANKAVLIDPVNLPWVMVLSPCPVNPDLRAFRRGAPPKHDAKITGSFLTLLALIDGESDSDALFFSRDLKIEGDTESVVALRNAIDDMDSSLAKSIADDAGPLSPALHRMLALLHGVRKASA